MQLRKAKSRKSMCSDLGEIKTPGRKAQSTRKGESTRKKAASTRKELPTRKRTPSGDITKKVRDKTATLSDDRFPIFDEKSAKAAIGLRGRGTTPAERAKILRKASKYAPEAAAKAKAVDKKKGV